MRTQKDHDRIRRRAPILLFDGDCAMCSASVRFVLAHERSPRIMFAALQSAAARRILLDLGMPTDRFDTVVLVEQDRVYTRSDAFIQLGRSLRWPWRDLGAVSIIPRFVRDRAYQFFARRRQLASRVCNLAPIDPLRIVDGHRGA